MSNHKKPETYEEWIVFVFDHPVEGGDPWYYSADVDVLYDAQQHVSYLTRLCTEFVQVTESYTLEQVNRGIWFLLGGYNCFPEMLFGEEVPLGERLACIRSMYHVYADFVAVSNVEVMENCFEMWWDLVADDFWSTAQNHHQNVSGGCRRPKRSSKRDGPSDAREGLESGECETLDAMFDTLAKILHLDDGRTQSYALHGLGHLHHPGVKDLVQRYINEHREGLTAEDVKWLEECRDGTVM